MVGLNESTPGFPARIPVELAPGGNRPTGNPAPPTLNTFETKVTAAPPPVKSPERPEAEAERAAKVKAPLASLSAQDQAYVNLVR